MSRRSSIPARIELMDWEPPVLAPNYSTDVIGRGRLESKISRLIGQALRDARDDGKSRATVATELGEYLGRNISEASLNKWAAESSDEHRIPLDVFIALIHVTGAVELLGFVAGLFALSVIGNEHAEMLEAQLLEEHMEEVQNRIQALQQKRRKRI